MSLALVKLCRVTCCEQQTEHWLHDHRPLTTTTSCLEFLLVGRQIQAAPMRVYFFEVLTAEAFCLGTVSTVRRVFPM